MNKKLDAVRTEIMGSLKALMETEGYEVLITGSQELCVPIVSEDREEEGYLKMTFSLPTGSHTGEPYDGHEVAKNYAFDLEAKARKAAEAKAKKEAKAARDAELRRQKAELRAKEKEVK